MNTKLYTEHLIQNLNRHKENTIRQQGKCDLETTNYLEKTENLYQTIIGYINQSPPAYYVKSLDIILDEKNLISGIKYVYCKEIERPDYVYINIYE